MLYPSTSCTRTTWARTGALSPYLPLCAPARPIGCDTGIGNIDLRLLYMVLFSLISRSTIECD